MLSLIVFISCGAALGALAWYLVRKPEAQSRTPQPPSSPVATKVEQYVTTSPPQQVTARDSGKSETVAIGDKLETRVGRASAITAKVVHSKTATPPVPPTISEKPDLALALVYTKEPAFVFVNKSGVVLREPKMSPGIWNLDRPDPNTGGTPTILPIPVESGDWIRPHGARAEHVHWPNQRKTVLERRRQAFWCSNGNVSRVPNSPRLSGVYRMWQWRLVFRIISSNSTELG